MRYEYVYVRYWAGVAMEWGRDWEESTVESGHETASPIVWSCFVSLSKSLVALV